MNNFDYMGFGYGAGYIDYFVADAKKYTPKNVLALCCLEYSHLFLQQFEGTHRNPVLNDIEQKYVAYRMGVDESWPKGCYTFVRKGSPGSFPVYVINLNKLKKEGKKNDS